MLAAGSADGSGTLAVPVWYSYQPGGTVSPAVVEMVSQAERVELARRYLGTELGDAYIAANPYGSQIVFRMTPERWLAVDFAKVYG